MNCRTMRTNENKSPTISVTMASYNVAPYVVATLESILAQEWADFELIVVDDASTDGTRDALQEVAERDTRVRLFLKDTNEGLAVARNLGIAKARGEWVTFLDADDLYDNRMLRLAIEAGRQHCAEMVIWDYVVFNDESQIDRRKTVPSMLGDIEGEDRFALLDRPAFSWTRLVRRDALVRFGISFPPGLTYQDVPVHWRLITQLEVIALVPQRLAYYRQRPTATTAGKDMKRADYFVVLDQVESYLQEEGLLDRYSDVLTARQLNAWYGVYDAVAGEYKSQVRAMISARLADRHRLYISSGKPLRWRTRVYFRSTDGDIIATFALMAHTLIRWVYRHFASRN
jgi:glycosyltransferase involved in cell wall biosynthesis